MTSQKKSSYIVIVLKSHHQMDPVSIIYHTTISQLLFSDYFIKCLVFGSFNVLCPLSYHLSIILPFILIQQRFLFFVHNISLY